MIVVTRRLENGKAETYRLVLNTGNSFAVYGAARQWVTEEEAKQRNRIPDEDEESG
jgi:hypothetical protein